MLRKATVLSIRALIGAGLLALAIPVAAELPPPAQAAVSSTPASPPPASADQSKRGFSIDPNG